MKKLDFYWRLGDFALKATPKRLVRFSPDEENETIDFVRYYRDGKHELCYSIGYFKWNEGECCWELKFVGDRFKEIPDDMVVEIFQMLRAAYDILNGWKRGQNEESL